MARSVYASLMRRRQLEASRSGETDTDPTTVQRAPFRVGTAGEGLLHLGRPAAMGSGCDRTILARPALAQAPGHGASSPVRCSTPGGFGQTLADGGAQAGMVVGHP